MTAPPPPGWYPDQGGRVRWWDGRGWTGHEQSPPGPSRTRWVLAIVGSVLLVAGIMFVIAHSVSGSPASSIDGCARVMRSAIDTGRPAPADVPAAPECTNLGPADYAKAKDEALRLANH